MGTSHTRLEDAIARCRNVTGEMLRNADLKPTEAQKHAARKLALLMTTIGDMDSGARITAKYADLLAETLDQHLLALMPVQGTIQ